MEKFFNIFGIFSRAAELRKNPMLADIYADMTDRSNYRTAKTIDEYKKDPLFGIKKDLENRRKDRMNLVNDFGKAFQAAKLRLGA
ncbi:MAG: hypothetical protein FWH22_04860 [Fibromonadales bacterium]|nr:hypothetical protein [Fibromonadales bacterium]